ncbi:hypothetical protein ATKI12_8940 [Kitasatospora sp. Ki12]
MTRKRKKCNPARCATGGVPLNPGGAVLPGLGEVLVVIVVVVVAAALVAAGLSTSAALELVMGIGLLGSKRRHGHA